MPWFLGVRHFLGFRVFVAWRNMPFCVCAVVCAFELVFVGLGGFAILVSWVLCLVAMWF